MQLKAALKGLLALACQRADALALLSQLLQRPESFCYAEPDYCLSEAEQQGYQQLCQRLQMNEPIAHILGYQNFCGLTLQVTSATLIPRAETEHMVDWVLRQGGGDQAWRVADLGTGSGAIACALAKARPGWQVDATDQSQAALTVARQNVADLQLMNVACYAGDWCQALPTGLYDLIVSNPPYIDTADEEVAAGVRLFEPASALFASESGLACLRVIAEQARSYLRPKGLLVMEHGHRQAGSVVKLLESLGYQAVSSHADWFGRDRFVSAVAA